MQEVAVMVRRLHKEFALLFLAATVALLARPLTCAQTPTPPQDIDELRRRLEQLEETTRQQIEALHRRIAQQEDEITRLRQQSQQPAIASTPPSRLQQRQTTKEVQSETFNSERESAPRINNAPLDPAMRGFFSIPGTPARIKFGSYAKLDAMFDPLFAGDQDEFVTTTIPVPP
jgi:TolA-binding protein